MTRRTMTTVLFMLILLTPISCASRRPPTGERLDTLTREVEATVSLFRSSDAGVARFFERSYGWAVFPDVVKGAAGIGGANGRGLVFEDGRAVGYATVSQATIGLQLGGQAYREIIFFQTRTDLDRFKAGGFEFDAQASAVAVRAGASADANYTRGVAVFTMARGGLMYEASVGGQRFTYEPLHAE